jgi:hypothetical protein
MYARLPSVFQNPDAARNENMTSRARRINSEGASQSTPVNLEMSADWIFRKKRAWSHRNAAKRNVVALLTISESVAITRFR